jgi:Na+(H+)/acetate symporter ActP
VDQELVGRWNAQISDRNHDGIPQLNEFFMGPDIVVLTTPEMAGLPYVISGLVVADALLLLAIANALNHDLYYKRPSAALAAAAQRFTRLAIVPGSGFNTSVGTDCTGGNPLRACGRLLAS